VLTACTRGAILISIFFLCSRKRYDIACRDRDSDKRIPRTLALQTGTQLIFPLNYQHETVSKETRCIQNGRDEKCIKSLDRKTWNEETTWETPA
jgi:hypothetical protein